MAIWVDHVCLAQCTCMVEVQLSIHALSGKGLSNRGLILFALWWAKKFTRNDGFIPYFDENTFLLSRVWKKVITQTEVGIHSFFAASSHFGSAMVKSNDGKHEEARIGSYKMYFAYPRPCTLFTFVIPTALSNLRKTLIWKELLRSFRRGRMHFCQVASRQKSFLPSALSNSDLKC